jgi:hypothetical protein
MWPGGPHLEGLGRAISRSVAVAFGSRLVCPGSPSRPARNRRCHSPLTRNSELALRLTCALTRSCSRSLSGSQAHGPTSRAIKNHPRALQPRTRSTASAPSTLLMPAHRFLSGIPGLPSLPPSPGTRSRVLLQLGAGRETTARFRSRAKRWLSSACLSIEDDFIISNLAGFGRGTSQFSYNPSAARARPRASPCALGTGKTSRQTGQRRRISQT